MWSNIKHLLQAIVMIAIIHSIAYADNKPMKALDDQQSHNISTTKDNKLILVTGVGVTRDAAIQNALRQAVEMNSGVFIVSETEVSNLQLVKDNIIATCNGYINTYKIISDNKKGDVYDVRLEVEVNEDKIQAYVRSKVKTIDVSNINIDSNIVKDTKKRISNNMYMMKLLAKKIESDGYTSQITGYKIEEVTNNKTYLDLYVNVRPNPYVWGMYKKYLITIKEKDKDRNKICEIGPYDNSNPAEILYVNGEIARFCMNTKEYFNGQANRITSTVHGLRTGSAISLELQEPVGAGNGMSDEEDSFYSRPRRKRHNRQQANDNPYEILSASTSFKFGVMPFEIRRNYDVYLIDNVLFDNRYDKYYYIDGDNGFNITLRIRTRDENFINLIPKLKVRIGKLSGFYDLIPNLDGSSTESDTEDE